METIKEFYDELEEHPTGHYAVLVAKAILIVGKEIIEAIDAHADKVAEAIEEIGGDDKP